MSDLAKYEPKQLAETPKPLDLVDVIIALESGTLSDRDLIITFAHLVQTGLAWSLQGWYGRTAASLIEGGYINEAGEILVDIGSGRLEGEA